MKRSVIETKQSYFKINHGYPSLPEISSQMTIWQLNLIFKPVSQLFTDELASRTREEIPYLCRTACKYSTKNHLDLHFLFVKRESRQSDPFRTFTNSVYISDTERSYSDQICQYYNI